MRCLNAPSSVLVFFVSLLLYGSSSLAAEPNTYVNGYFDSSSPTWARVLATTPQAGVTCSNPATSELSYNTNVRYTQYEIIPKVTQNFVGQVISSDNYVDTMMALYCSPFDPDQPQENLLAMDDDGNGYPYPGLTNRAIPLTAGNSYYLVVTSYSNYNPNGAEPLDGGFTLELGDNFTHRHSLGDAIAALQVLSGVQLQKSAIASLSDLPCFCPEDDGRLTLAKVIRVLQNLSVQ